FLVEIGAVDRIADPDDPARVAAAPANLELHDPHPNDLPGRRGARGQRSAHPFGRDPLDRRRIAAPPVHYRKTDGRIEAQIRCRNVKRLRGPPEVGIFRASRGSFAFGRERAKAANISRDLRIKAAGRAYRFDRRPPSRRGKLTKCLPRRGASRSLAAQTRVNFRRGPWRARSSWKRRSGSATPRTSRPSG